MLRAIGITVALTVNTLLAATLVFGGCAAVRVKPLDPTKKNQDGLRFYRSVPYLLVSPDDQGNPQTKVVYLPKTTEEYVVRREGRWGATNMEVTLDGGWNLIKLGTAIDSKGPETIAALTGGISAFKEAKERMLDEPLAPSLWRIVFDDSTGYAIGLVKVSIEQTLVTSDTESSDKKKANANKNKNN
jgi:hypothetical protein